MTATAPTAFDDAVDAAAARIAALLAGDAAPAAEDAAPPAADQIADTLAGLVAPTAAAAGQTAADVAALTSTLDDMTGAVAELAARQAAPPQPRPAAGDPTAPLGLAADAPNPNALGARLDGVFADFADFVTAAYRRDGRVLRVPQSGNVTAALDGEELPDGGALVPEEFRAALLRLSLIPTSIRARATVIPMMSATLDIPYLRDTTHAGGQLYGGIYTYWLEAGDRVTYTDPEFAQVHLTAKNLVAGCIVRNTLLADSFTSVPALLGMLYPEALRRAEERAFLRGDGAGQPLGIFNSDALIDVARASGSNNVDAADIHNMEARLMPGSETRAVWMIHPALRADLGQLNLGGVQYWQEDLSQPRPMTLNGRPVILSEFCSAPGTAGDIVLADWMYYLIADRQTMSMASSAHEKFSELATVFRFNCRLDAQPWIDSPLTLEHGGSANTVSPFVRLAA